MDELSGWVEQIIINFLLHLNFISIRIMLQLYPQSNVFWKISTPPEIRIWGALRPDFSVFHRSSKFHSSNSLTNLSTHLDTLDGDNEGRRHLYNVDHEGILIQQNSEVFWEFNNLITYNCWNVVDFSLYFVLHPLPF